MIKISGADEPSAISVRLATVGFHWRTWKILVLPFAVTFFLISLEVIFSIDASMHALKGDCFDPSYELDRARRAAERLGVDLPPIDMKSYVTRPVSFHTDGKTLLICLPLLVGWLYVLAAAAA